MELEFMEKANKTTSLQDQVSALIENSESEVCRAEPCEGESADGFLANFFRGMGGPSFVIGAAEVVLSNAGRLMPDNKRYQTAVRVARGVIPAATLGYKVYSAFKFASEMSAPKEESPYARRRRIAKELLGLSDGEDAPYLRDHEMELGEIVVAWLLELPETETLRILGVHPEDDAEKVVTALGMGYHLVKASLKDVGEVVFRMRSSYISSLKSIEIYRPESISPVDVFTAVMKAFLESREIENTVIQMDGFRMSSPPRPSLGFTPTQLSDDMVVEIRNCISRERRRTYAMIGEPGCGKSTVALKIQDLFREIPVIVINLAESSHIRDIAPAYMLARSVSPAIVILEDIDQLDLRSKSSASLGVLIEILDSTKMLRSVITIMTLNEPDKVHPSLMDRRGRIDRILRFGPPKTDAEVREVLQVWSRELFDTELPEVGRDFYDDILREKLNHADIRELVEQCKISEDRITEAALRKALEKLQRSKRDLQEFIRLRRRDPWEDLRIDDELSEASCESACR